MRISLNTQVICRGLTAHLHTWRTFEKLHQHVPLLYCLMKPFDETACFLVRRMLS